MTRKTFFRFAWAVTILLSFGLGCKIVDEVSGTVNEAIEVATEIGGLTTDIDIGGLTTAIDIGGVVTGIGGMVTEIGGIVTEIDIEGMSTEMGSISTEMGSIMTDLPGIPGFDETPSPVLTPAGFPSDIPLMEGEKSEMSGTATQLTYSVDAELTAAVDFYRREMPLRNWVEQSYTTAEGEATLIFQQGSRRVTIVVSEGFFFDISVDITIG